MSSDGAHSRIAYVYLEPFPISNVVVGELLKERFPEHPVDTISLLDILRQDRLWFARNGIETLLTYGLDIARRRRQLRASFVHTPAFFQRASELLRERLDPERYRFTFQIQSLFDASCPGVPHFVYTDHTNLANLMYPGGASHALYPEAWRALEATIYHHARLVFVRSSHVERSLVEHYDVASERVRCVYAGSNTESPTAATRPDDAARYGEKRILFVGIDWTRKGGPVLLEAFRKVLHVHPDAHLTIVGCDPGVAAENVEVLGRLGVEELADHYERATVFCMPTEREPFGIVYVEAMTHGLPVVASDVGALPDMVEEGVNGHLVAPGDPDALAARLSELLGDPERCRRMGQEARRLALERYTWDAVGRRLERHIRDALQQA